MNKLTHKEAIAEIRKVIPIATDQELRMVFDMMLYDFFPQSDQDLERNALMYLNEVREQKRIKDEIENIEEKGTEE